MSLKFKVFSNCVPVSGFNRSIIYEIQNGTYFFIPNSLFDILIKYDKHSILEVKKEYDLSVHSVIDEYFMFLKEKNTIFFTSEPELFPYIDMKWDYPFHISNSILEYNDINYFNSSKIANQLDHLGCKFLQIRIYSQVANNFVKEILNLFEKGKQRAIELILRHNIDIIRLKDYNFFFKFYKKIMTLSVYSSPVNEVSYINRTKTKHVFFTQENIDCSHCGIIHPSQFTINIKLFTESIHYNTCLNRKISIDADGNIKNCPSMNCSYGNIKNTTLEEAINKPNFKDLWSIKKDEIDVCKDCEFRYMCTDCRCFIKDPNNIYSQPAKCSYNPYIALWKGQEGWISVEQWRGENPNWEKDVVRLIPGKDYYKD